ncbi:syndecan-like isoform X2 [Ornithodoros turicata]|uniref:syndecan-like isoform X2 n=1 Tax=Ornithodoros turicata TaxID=34597 RepID=UPI003138F47F
MVTFPELRATRVFDPPGTAKSETEKHGDNGMFFIDDTQSDQGIEGSAGGDLDSSSGHEDDEDAVEGSGSTPVEFGSGKLPGFIVPKTKDVTDTTTRTTTRKPSVRIDQPKGNEIPDFPAVSTRGPTHDKAPPEDDFNELGNNIPVLQRKQEDRPSSFFAQPGILAAVIGGAVVGLLCAILLVMFIVYRMRKKDEGSYALDEPKRSPTVNSYMRGSNKEFYA